jgi:hypothetical protein
MVKRKVTAEKPKLVKLDTPTKADFLLVFKQLPNSRYDHDLAASKEIDILDNQCNELSDHILATNKKYQSLCAKVNALRLKRDTALTIVLKEREALYVDFKLNGVTTKNLAKLKELVRSLGIKVD